MKTKKRYEKPRMNAVKLQCHGMLTMSESEPVYNGFGEEEEM